MLRLDTSFKRVSSVSEILVRNHTAADQTEQQGRSASFLGFSLRASTLRISTVEDRLFKR